VALCDWWSMAAAHSPAPLIRATTPSPEWAKSLVHQTLQVIHACRSTHSQATPRKQAPWRPESCLHALVPQRFLMAPQCCPSWLQSRPASVRGQTPWCR
jgi:hypothetical protein